MKKLLLIVFGLLLTSSVFAQFESRVLSSNGIQFIPKTTTELNTATLPFPIQEEGLMVYNITTGTYWQRISGLWIDLGQDELQTLTLNGTTLEVRDSQGRLSQDVDLSSLTGVASSVEWVNVLNIPADFADGVDNVDDADADASNEFQTLSKAGFTVTLSDGGGSVTTDDADADPSNEFQTLSINGSDLTISDGNTVTLPAGGGGTDDQTGSEVPLTTTNFDNNLSASDTNVQLALETLDELTVAAGSVDFVSNVATSVILGRVTGGSGNSEELTPAQVRTLINVEDNAAADQTAAEVSVSAGGFSGNLSGTDTDVQTALNTIDALVIGGGTVDVVSNVATSTILGRTTGGSGDSEELSASQVRTLINVEDGATADQTGAEIKAAYEGEADTNAFTDAEQTKLGGIETAAKDDQNSSEVPYDNTASNLNATNVKDALDELKEPIEIDTWNGLSAPQQAAVKFAVVYDADGATTTSIVQGTSATLTSAAGSITWVGDEANTLNVTLTEDTTIQNPSTPQIGAIYQFIVTQDSNGLHTLSWGNQFAFPDGTAPVMTLDPNAVDVYTAYWNGTIFITTYVQNFLTP